MSAQLRRFELAILIFAMLLPTAGTWLYFVVFAGSDWIKAAYGGTKMLQFALPLVWLVLVLKEKIRPQRPTVAGWGWGIGFGLAVMAAMWLLYSLWLKPSGQLVRAVEEIEVRLSGLGLFSRGGFLLLAVFYCLAHSFLEEYYWRWFVYGRLKQFTGIPTANVLSSLAFAAHHVILVAVYFPGDYFAIGFFSLSVAVGGAFWAWLYERSESLYSPWVSHLFVDAGLMLVGYDLLWGLG